MIGGRVCPCVAKVEVASSVGGSIFRRFTCGMWTCSTAAAGRWATPDDGRERARGVGGAESTGASTTAVASSVALRLPAHAELSSASTSPIAAGPIARGVVWGVAAALNFGDAKLTTIGECSMKRLDFWQTRSMPSVVCMSWSE